MPETKPRKPTMTLERKVAALSPYHAEALRVLSKGDDQFKAGLRAELDGVVERDALSLKVARTKAAYEAAVAERAAFLEPGDHFAKRLDALAKSIADATGAIPDANG